MCLRNIFKIIKMLWEQIISMFILGILTALVTVISLLLNVPLQQFLMNQEN